MAGQNTLPPSATQTKRTNSKELLEKLTPLRPALAAMAVIPALNRFCFEGKYVHAWDDSLGIRTECDLGFVGGIEGRELIKYLKACPDAEMTVQHQNGGVLFSTGSSSLLFESIPKDQFLFELPKGKTKDITIGSEFIRALALMQNSINEDTVNLQQAGVTIEFKDGGMILNATNDDTISSYVFVCGSEEMETKILHNGFCSALVSLHKLVGDSETELEMSIGKNYASVSIGDYMILGKVLNAKPLPFGEIVGGLEEDSVDVPIMEIPEGMAASLKRLSIASSECVLELAGNVLHMSASSDRRAAEEDISLPTSYAASPSIKAHTESLSMACGSCDTMKLCEDFILFKNSESGYLYAISGI